MGKHKNAQQVEIFIQFMEANPDLGKGFTKRNKALVDSLWLELATSLNAAGPPSKEVNGWKKVWTEWKFEVKKKLTHNKNESRATGGGPFTKHSLTQSDEAVARICSLDQAVNGVAGVSLGLNSSDDTDDDDSPTLRKKSSETPRTTSTPKRQRPEHISQRLARFLDEDNENKNQITDKINGLIEVQKEQASSLRRLYRSNETIAKAVTDLKNVSTLMVTAMQEKNEIRKKQLEVELLKLGMDKHALD